MKNFKNKTYLGKEIFWICVYDSFLSLEKIEYAIKMEPLFSVSSCTYTHPQPPLQ